jgi:hypothetical protein
MSSIVVATEQHLAVRVYADVLPPPAVMYWLASHEKSMDKRVMYILLSIQILHLDAALKDY